MKKWIALAGLLAALYFVVFHWGRFLQDFYPLDASRIAPNIIASICQYVVLGVGAYLLYPPVRRAVDRYIGGHVDSIKAHVSAEHALVHAKMDHIIKHTKAIPAFPPPTTDGSASTQDPGSPGSS